MTGKPDKYRIIFGFLLLLVAVGIWLVVHFQDQALATVKDSIDMLRGLQQQSPLLFVLGYAAAYIGCLLIFLPVDTIFMLLAGAIFTLPVAAFLACTVHTTGTMTTFFLSRNLLRRSRAAEAKSVPVPPTRRQVANAWFTLILLRLAPLVPTHGISLMMANSPLSPKGFYTATWCGSMPLTLFMVFVGREITTINSLHEVMTPYMIGGLIALMLILIVTKLMYSRYVKA